ncbi:MAG: transposase [Orrella sp.]
MDTDTTPTQTHLPKSGRTPRRKFTPEFKSRIVKFCEQPGADACEVAREHRLGSYLVNRWVREHRAREAPAQAHPHCR